MQYYANEINKLKQLAGPYMSLSLLFTFESAKRLSTCIDIEILYPPFKENNQPPFEDNSGYDYCDITIAQMPISNI